MSSKGITVKNTAHIYVADSSTLFISFLRTIAIARLITLYIYIILTIIRLEFEVAAIL